MLSAIAPCSSDVVAQHLDSICRNMNGSWALDKSRSESLAPFLKFVGAPWAMQQLVDSITPTRTFDISSSGMIDTQVTTGMMGSTQHQEWSWVEAPITMATGGKFPGFVTFDPEGRLVSKISHTKGLIITVFEPVVREGSVLTLVLRMICFDGSGNEAVAIRRVLTRPA